MRYGLAIVGSALVASIIMTLFWGPLYGVYDWRVVAVGLMALEMLVVVGLMGIMIRPPKPYNRMYALYGLGGLGPTDDPPANNLSWLWQVLPVATTASILLVTLRWL
jgi:hypothetical protein